MRIRVTIFFSVGRSCQKKQIILRTYTDKFSVYSERKTSPFSGLSVFYGKFAKSLVGETSRFNLFLIFAEKNKGVIKGRDHENGKEAVCGKEMPKRGNDPRSFLQVPLHCALGEETGKTGADAGRQAQLLYS